MNQAGNTILLLLISGLSFFMSAYTGPPINGRVKSSDKVVPGKSGINKMTYDYDKQGRVIHTETINETGTHTRTMVYSHDTVSCFIPEESNRKYATYILSPRGYMISENGKGTYVYDANGFLTFRDWPNGSTMTNVISNGDIISSTYKQGDTVTSSFVFTYYPGIDYRYYGVGYKGKQSTHLMKTQAFTSYLGNTLLSSYSYTFDAKGRVLLQTTTVDNTTSAPSISTVSYTYDD